MDGQFSLHLCKPLLFQLVLMVTLIEPRCSLSLTQPAVDAELNVREKVNRGPEAPYWHQKRPNIIFMMADDLGYGDVHYSGGNADTPNLDAMAAGPNSIHLTRYYSAAPVCSPTRGSVLTGRNPNRYCIWKASNKYPLPASERTIAEILREQGYCTAVYGKWHLGAITTGQWHVSNPGTFGFDKWYVTSTSRSHPHGDLDRESFKYFTVDFAINKLQRWPDLILRGYDSLFMLGRLSNFLESVSKTNKQFFVYLPFHAVHYPYVATAKYRELYLARNYSLEQSNYYGAISLMDEVVGQVQALLHHYNIFNNTMVWFTSDNGPRKLGPGKTAGLKGNKHTLWEGGIRVPGIIQWPAVIKENCQSDYPVVSSDFFPTICDILGIDPPADRPIDGISVLPFLRGEVTNRSTSIAWAYRILDGDFSSSYISVLIKGRYKLYANYSHGKVVGAQLYDLVDDWSETTDISEKHMELFQSMKAELEEWRMSVIRSATQVVQCT